MQQFMKERRILNVTCETLDSHVANVHEERSHLNVISVVLYLHKKHTWKYTLQQLMRERNHSNEMSFVLNFQED